MNSLFVQETANLKPLNGFLHDILTFLYFLPHQIGTGVIKLVQSIFPRIIFPDTIIDPLGFLIILTVFMILVKVVKKLAWIIVWAGWILLVIRILLIILKIG